MFCYKCGMELDDKAKFCHKCGTPQLLDNETVKMRPVKRNDGPASESQRSKEEIGEPSEGKAAPVKENAGPSDRHTAPAKENAGSSEGKAAPVKEKAGASDRHTAPVKENAGPSEGKAAPVKENAEPSDGHTAPKNEDRGSSDGHDGQNDSDNRKRNMILIIIILAVAAAAVVIFLLFFKDRTTLFSGQTSETAVSETREEGRNGGSFEDQEEAAADISAGSSEAEDASAEAGSAGGSSAEEDEAQMPAPSSEEADEAAAEGSAQADRDTSEEPSQSVEAAATEKPSQSMATPAPEKTSQSAATAAPAKPSQSAATAAPEKTSQSAATAAPEKPSKSSETASPEKSASSSGRPKITGNNTDQMELPGASQAPAGIAQEITATPSPADTAVASVVMASTVSTAGYTKAVVQSAKASSALFQPGYDNSANSAFDNNVITSWQDGVAGYGEGQVIDITLDREYQIHCINFNLGNWRGQQYYNENSRPKQVTLYLGTSRHYTVIFPDGMSQYSVLFSADVPASWIRVQIDSAYPGALYDDTCISEISFYASN